MEDSVDVLIEQWTAALGDIDPRVEGIVTRMQLIVRHVSSRKAESVAALGMQMWECATLYAMTNRVDAMVRRGYVVRRYDRDDRRRNVVALTRKGVAAAERIVAGQRDVEADLIATLTDAQQEQLITLLRRLMQAVDATF